MRKLTTIKTTVLFCAVIIASTWIGCNTDNAVEPIGTNTFEKDEPNWFAGKYSGGIKISNSGNISGRFSHYYYVYGYYLHDIDNYNGSINQDGFMTVERVQRTYNGHTNLLLYTSSYSDTGNAVLNDTILTFTGVRNGQYPVTYNWYKIQN